ncbi:exported hypothetical protein [Candidatus Zixiibacteriota bacterium]|nr:exported hypothetical protein [candidate division Zixibacteria bacterium]
MFRKLSFCILSFVALALYIISCDKGVEPQKQKPPDYGPNLSVQIDDKPVWSPDGTVIAYYHYGITGLDYDTTDPTGWDLSQRGIWLINPDGTNPRFLVQAGNATWSADSKWIYFMTDAAWKIKVTGDSLTKIGDGMAFCDPTFSPQGDKVVSHYSIGDSSGIWITYLKDTSLNHWSGTRGPVWHPSGDSIFWADSWTGYWIESLDHSYRRKIRVPLEGFEGPISYNDRTRMIVSDSKNGIAIFDINGGNLRIISVKASVPVWSPDGTKICYLGTEHKIASLWIINTDGTDRRKLTFEP